MCADFHLKAIGQVGKQQPHRKPEETTARRDIKINIKATGVVVSHFTAYAYRSRRRNPEEMNQNHSSTVDLQVDGFTIGFSPDWDCRPALVTQPTNGIITIL